MMEIFIGWLEGSEEGIRACFYQSMVVGAMFLLQKDGIYLVKPEAVICDLT